MFAKTLRKRVYTRVILSRDKVTLSWPVPKNTRDASVDGHGILNDEIKSRYKFLEGKHLLLGRLVTQFSCISSPDVTLKAIRKISIPNRICPACHPSRRETSDQSNARFRDDDDLRRNLSDEKSCFDTAQQENETSIALKGQ